MTHTSTLSLLRRATSFAYPHRWYLLVVIALTLCAAAAGSVEPLVLKFLFDELGKQPQMEAVLWAVVGLLALGVGREGATAISNYISWRTRLSIHYALVEAAVERIHHFSPDYHRNQGVGAIMTRLDRSIQGFITALSEISFNVLPSLAYLGIAMVMMFRLDWRLSLLVIGFAPLPGIIAAFAAPQQIDRERTLLTRWTRIYARFNEVLSGIVTVKSFAMDNHEPNRFLNEFSATNRIVARGVKFDSSVGAVQNAIVLVARIAAIGLGGVLMVRGEITLGTVVAFMGYVTGLFGPVQGLTSVYRVIRTAGVSLEQIFDILDTEHHIKDAPDAHAVQSLTGDVSFENVHFSYHDNAQVPLLKNISLRARPGEMVAIVGPSGSGKTTLMALLQRFFDPTEGVIRVDGHDVRALKQDSLRRQIGVVLQDALLFNESIRDNIAYGRPEATQAEIEASARVAHAHEFVSKMEDGYATVVGERGGRLSAGERQRIAIARALLKNPPLLVLDEATSALDAESEVLVRDAIERLSEGRTTFVIAHRLSTVVRADRIIVLKDGEIIEQGNHQTLLDNDGYYAYLVRQQTHGLLAA